MGRAARRAQQRAERRARQGQSATRSARAAVIAPAAPDGVVQRGSFFKPRWATDIISELRKVTWPTRRETSHLTLVVVVVSLIFGAMLGVADLGFNWLIEQTLLR